jgi:hypothetical protein
MPHTFYDEIRDQVDLDDGDIPFPEVMSAYEARFSRSDLISAFFNRKRYIDSFPSLRRRATRLHRAVGQIPFFREIVTSNWDDYFEEETGAVPLVQGADFDYWDLRQRKVLKIQITSGTGATSFAAMRAKRFRWSLTPTVLGSVVPIWTTGGSRHVLSITRR